MRARKKGARIRATRKVATRIRPPAYGHPHTGHPHTGHPARAGPAARAPAAPLRAAGMWAQLGMQPQHNLRIKETTQQHRLIQIQESPEAARSIGGRPDQGRRMSKKPCALDGERSATSVEAPHTFPQ